MISLRILLAEFENTGTVLIGRVVRLTVELSTGSVERQGNLLDISFDFSGKS